MQCGGEWKWEWNGSFAFFSVKVLNRIFSQAYTNVKNKNKNMGLEQNKEPNKKIFQYSHSYTCTLKYTCRSTTELAMHIGLVL